MKNNQIRELVNELRDIAIEYHGTQQLRERIARTVRAAWHHELEKPNQPVSQTYNLPELIEGMEVSIDVSTCDADAGNRYFGTVTEVSELYTAKNGYILLVQDAKPNFDVNGNTPVQSPIDHGYRPECECSGCKATARICAELNNEEEEIFADGYNAAMQSFGNSEQLNFPVAPDEIEPDDGNTFDYVDGWNACRAAMLQSKHRDLSQPVDPQVAAYEQIMLQAGNSPVIPEGSFSGLVNSARALLDVLYEFGADEVAISEYVTNLEDALRVAAAPQQEVK